ncbi:ArpU family phage packaging/lysis transcriptional regulator [Bacillus sp. YIM B13601]|uniref:ArpU family phage packaging/lysis transcriptional regulator n=1 Tax=Bacillus TaxID=1386 RepID=UPI001CB7AB5D|nr:MULTISPECIES: ArpU family phage packaging/lysis transcriptional regulator [Bacillus]MCQ9138388.1 hypothetical protein [Bacillus amyloliquefaciens]MDR0153839.1 ArpU family phage packaging/lysis transcriptional regulator [Bacillus velezensis]MDZ5642915.1 ArpU family phage packaging/lysis transcriptional regulator [Bacillus sp. TJS119]MEA3584105.1 ArpU family phage packaging/lysis transcriptional regulator [Bacillus velezensis]MEC0888452.1 ArpU family phage packaging/lysis transcriptional regu
MWRYNPHSYATRKKRYVIAIDKLHIVFSFFICFDDPFVYLFQLQPIEPLFCGKTTFRLFFKFLKESVDAGISPFPSIRDSFILNELKVKQMERALENSLDDEERMILEKKYLAASQTKDIHIYMELGMKKGTCYEIKQRAIVRIATALGII